MHRLASIKASVPFAYVSGSVAGSSLSRSVAGAGDASLQLTTLLLGGPALSVADFEKYEPTTTVGVSLTVSGPSGHRESGMPQFHQSQLRSSPVFYCTVVRTSILELSVR